ncbi:unnamed protein product, partial [Ectocarpus sp. 12 AP-2014]
HRLCIVGEVNALVGHAILCEAPAASALENEGDRSTLTLPIASDIIPFAMSTAASQRYSMLLQNQDHRDQLVDKERGGCRWTQNRCSPQPRRSVTNPACFQWSYPAPARPPSCDCAT